MLVLTRRLGERILVGDDIAVEILAVDGGKVRVGIEAPRALEVDREEIRDQKDERRRRLTELAR